MKVMLINPLSAHSMERIHAKENNLTTNKVQHLGVAYIAGMLEENGFEVVLIDKEAVYVDNTEILKIISDNNISVIGVSLFYYNYLDSNRLITQIKRKYPESFVFIGGYYPTFQGNDLMSKMNHYDCCIILDGEVTVLKLVERIRDAKDWRDLDNIIFRDDDRIIENKISKPYKNLDDMPFPKRIYFFKQNGIRMTTMISSRGCIGRCSFCGSGNYYAKMSNIRVHYRSVENVIKELKELIRKYSVQFVTFYDECFLSNSKSRKMWISNFINYIKDLKLDFMFYIYSRADMIEANYQLLKELKNVGLHSVFLGVESFIPRQLKLYSKDIDPSVNKKAIKLLSELGIKCNIGFILLDPYSTIGEVEENLLILKELKFYENCSNEQPPISCLSPLFPTPDSPIEDLFLNNKLLDKNHITMYKFNDCKVDLFSTIISKWRTEIYPLYKKRNTYHPFESQEKINVISYDLNFLILTSKKIRRGEINLENYNEFLIKQIEIFHTAFSKKEFTHV